MYEIEKALKFHGYWDDQVLQLVPEITGHHNFMTTIGNLIIVS